MVKPSLTSVAERDIDMLLVEEFVSAPTFARWFARRCGVAGLRGKPVKAAQLRVTRSNGESDVEVRLARRDGSLHCLMIENKVAAGVQPRQAVRYRERGAGYVRSGECAACTCVLIAPRRYLGEHPERLGFDRYVAYEDLRAWFAGRAGARDRMAAKAAVLTCAIDKSRLGYVPGRDQSVSRFWHDYWELCTRLAPELEMTEPTGKPARAGFVQFHPDGLPKDVTLVHKLPHGKVDLQFSGLGGRLSVLRTRFARRLEPGMAVKRASGSGAVRLDVPTLDTTRPLRAQSAAARKGIGAARRLLRWYRRRPSN
jgi:hypothetical protein